MNKLKFIVYVTKRKCIALFDVLCKHSKTILMHINPYLSVIVALILKEAKINAICALIVPLLINFIIYIATCLEVEKYSTKYMIPIARKKFVQKQKDNEYYVDKEDWYELVEYVSVLEERLDELGCYTVQKGDKV